MAGRDAGPPRVLVYADSAIFSGAESVICDVVAGLRDRGGFDLTVAAPASNPELTGGLTAAAGVDEVIPVPPQRMRLAAFALYDPRRTTKVRAALAAAEPDVILLNLPSAEYGSTPLLVRPDPVVPVVGFMHVSGAMGDLGFHFGGIRERLARRAVSTLDAVFVLSPEARREYPGQWSPKATELNLARLPRPELERVDRGPARERLGLPPDAPVIGTAGRLTIRQKGQDTLVEAAAELVGGRPDLMFAIAGEGRDRAQIERLIDRRGLGEHFRFLGQVGDMTGFLSAIDLIAIPSRFEGLPLVAIEALAVGTPGVASSVDGLRDIWPEAWRVEPSDPKQLAATLSQVLDTEESSRQELLSSGRRVMEGLTSSDPSADVAECLLRMTSND